MIGLHQKYNILLVFFPAALFYHHAMQTMPSRNQIPFDRPGIYEIRVQGQIDPTWLDLLKGLAICQTVDKAGSPVTKLKGELNDQAALAGVLNILYELHLSLISVIKFETE